MLVNENLLRYMFSKHSIIKYIMSIIATLVILFFITILFVYFVYDDYYDKQVDNLNIANLTVTRNMPLEDALLYKCNIVGCKALSVNIDGKDVYYVMTASKTDASRIKLNKTMALELTKTDGDIKTSIFNSHFTTDYNLIITNGNIRYVINDNSYVLYILSIYLYLYIIIFLLITVIFIINAINTYKYGIYKKGSYKLYIESKLQANITEMVHHEMNAPLAILNTLVANIKSILIEQHIEDKYKDTIEGFDYAIKRIEAVLDTLSNNKRIKYKVENISILEVIKHVITNVNRFKVGAVKAEYNNQDALSKYKASSKLSTGELMNILHVMITNSTEAGGNIILFTAMEVSRNTLELYVTDNGHGVRDHSNRIVTDDAIFQYGYSTKDSEGKHVNFSFTKNIIYKILKLFGISVMIAGNSRGIGLYMNKVLLNRIDGDIELYKTSSLGTTFKITLPVEPIDPTTTEKKN